MISVALAAPIAIGSAACGGQQPTKVATVKAADMPEGGEWTGVFYDQTNGYLHLVKEGDTVSGKWRTTAGDAWGELSGKVTGNLLKYEWKEHRIGMVGPSATRTGRGYFSYTEPKPGEAHEINGEFGLGMDETGRARHGRDRHEVEGRQAAEHEVRPQLRHARRGRRTNDRWRLGRRRCCQAAERRRRLRRAQ